MLIIPPTITTQSCRAGSSSPEYKLNTVPAPNPDTVGTNQRCEVQNKNTCAQNFDILMFENLRKFQASAMKLTILETEYSAVIFITDHKM